MVNLEQGSPTWWLGAPVKETRVLEENLDARVENVQSSMVKILDPTGLFKIYKIVHCDLQNTS